MNIENNLNTGNVVPISIEKEMKRSYLDYSMSVIVSRALPDCRDGLKPVHRRILYGMYDMNNTHDKPFKKSARIVGEVIGKYHPHGDGPIYMALVRMAQEFSLREPLVTGQGNFGSIDGDAPAAMRYTEVRLSKISQYMLMDIDKDTVGFVDNYDGSEQEPKILPSRFPNLLINGASGIAVGMATNIPTHNLVEVINGCLAYIENPEISGLELTEYIPAPDFPTSGIIVGAAAAKAALLTGRGSIIMRGKVLIEQASIIITELPYQVNKAELVKKIEHLSRDKIIEGISELRDETNKLGIRIVIELKRDVMPEVIVNQLYKHTDLQTSFGVNMLALDNGKPAQMGIKEIIGAFISFRREVVTKRTIFELNKARKRAHILIGLFIAVSNIDKVIQIIKSSANVGEAKERLMQEVWVANNINSLLALIDDKRNVVVDDQCKLTIEQCEAILDMKLARLTALEKEKLADELKALGLSIQEYLELLNSKEKIFNLIAQELIEVKEKFGTPRKTQIIDAEGEFNAEDFVQPEEMVVTITMGGYIKRVPLSMYRAQRRGGKGKSGMTVYDDDSTTHVLVANTHATVLFFSSYGKVYKEKVYRLPLGAPQGRGKAIVNLLPIASDEDINNILPLPLNSAEWNDYSIIFITQKGYIKRNAMELFSRIQANGKIAIKQLGEDDKLINVGIGKADDHVLLCTKYGKAIRFKLSKIRVFKSRNSSGIRGIKLIHAQDAVVSMSIISEAEVSLDKREEFLKIPVEVRLAYKETKDLEVFNEEIKNIAFEKLTLEEAAKLAEEEQLVLTITENGYGKRTSLYEYRITGRGGSGILNIDTSERNGLVVSSIPVGNKDEIMMITSKGTILRIKVSSIRITGRQAKGVKIISLDKNEKLISVTKVVNDEEILEDVIQEEEEILI